MEEVIRSLVDAASSEIAASGDDLKALDQVRVRYLGRKGELAQLFKKLGVLSESERREAGRILNEAKLGLDEKLTQAQERAKDKAQKQKELFDVTVPGRRPVRGRLHPITQISLDVSRIF